MAHDAYESFMEQIGFAFAGIIRDSDFLIAIVRAEADFLAQLNVGDRLEVNLSAEKVGETSYTLVYKLKRSDDSPAGRVRTVHVCIDKATRQKRPLPDDLREALEAHL
jgi:1,4-dihydroxy-2-naphthoyl-CoA hydrolase